MSRGVTEDNALERAVCAVICRGDGLKARQIAKELDLDHGTVNSLLYSSPLMKELCWQDRDYRWHGIIRQERPHAGLMEFSGYYSLVRDFLSLSEDAFLERLTMGCDNIGRSLSDARGLFHSFRDGRSLSDARGLTHSFLDCREQVRVLLLDLQSMIGESCLSWQLAFELRLKRSRHVRMYADVLVITEDRVFSLEFKMKKTVEPEEVEQAAKYVPYLEIVFGPMYEIIPVLVLTGARELFEFVPIGKKDRLLPVCSGDMLFNVFDEYLGFLQ